MHTSKTDSTLIWRSRGADPYPQRQPFPDLASLPSTRYWSAAKEIVPVSESLRTTYLHKAAYLPPDSLDILVPKPIHKIHF